MVTLAPFAVSSTLLPSPETRFSEAPFALWDLTEICQNRQGVEDTSTVSFRDKNFGTVAHPSHRFCFRQIMLRILTVTAITERQDDSDNTWRKKMIVARDNCLRRSAANHLLFLSELEVFTHTDHAGSGPNDIAEDRQLVNFESWEESHGEVAWIQTAGDRER